ncbi:MAG: hypothetical protein JXM75_00840 [Chromatiaceae bacterium]|nr:hypothetical protein [Chromatiaceae bacterium]
MRDEQILSLGASGWYRDNESANDAYRLDLLGAWSRESASGRGLWQLDLSAGAYRDALVPADERDEVAIGLRYDHLLSARQTLGLSAELRRLDYRHVTGPWAGRPGSAPNPESARASDLKNGARNQGQSARPREDRALTLGLDLTQYWSPDLSTQLALTYAANESSVRLEGYRRPGLTGLMRWDLSDLWRLEAGAGWLLSRYGANPREREREDRQLSLNLSVFHRLARSAAEWQCRLEWLDNDSTLADYSFQQWVTDCGLSWSLR